MLEILLASQSPRRRELLTAAGFEHRVFPVKVSEIIDENLNPQEVVSHLATIKAEACIEQCKDLNLHDFLILSGDTLVALGDQILGKPQNFSQACDFLRQLSGQTHSVISGLCLIETASSRRWSGFDTTRVRFKTLSETQIQDYVHSGEPMDKAGAYAIQGEGRKFVADYQGSFSNVVGLPVELLEKALRENNWKVKRVGVR